MRRIPYRVGRTIVTATHDSAIVNADEQPGEALVEAIVGTISTDIMVEAGGIMLHLAAWIDPDHWSSDWEAAGVNDPDAFIAGLVEEAA